MIEFDVDMGYLLEEEELDRVILNDENGEHEPIEFVPKAVSGTCELEPLSALDVTLNMLNETSWGVCSECGTASPMDATFCCECGRKVKR